MNLPMLQVINAIHPRFQKMNEDVAQVLNQYTAAQRSAAPATGDRVRFAMEIWAPNHNPDRVSVDVRVMWQVLADAYSNGYAAARLAFSLERQIASTPEADLTPKEALADAVRAAARGLRRADDLHRSAAVGADDAALNDVLSALDELAERLDPREA